MLCDLKFVCKTNTLSNHCSRDMRRRGLIASGSAEGGKLRVKSWIFKWLHVTDAAASAWFDAGPFFPEIDGTDLSRHENYFGFPARRLKPADRLMALLELEEHLFGEVF